MGLDGQDPEEVPFSQQRLQPKYRSQTEDAVGHMGLVGLPVDARYERLHHLPYRIPNAWVDAYCVYTNRTPTSAMRGFGVTMGHFAVEVQMDKIARLCGLDPWTVRFRNAHRNGDIKPHRKATADATLIETMQAAAELVGVELAPELRAMTSAPRDAVASAPRDAVAPAPRDAQEGDR